jgi:hypothetical protein
MFPSQLHINRMSFFGLGLLLAVPNIGCPQPTEYGPTIESFSADPSSVEPGFEVTLTWSVLDVDTCAIEPELGAVEAQDSLAVTPMETTTYVLSCGEGESAVTAEVLVTVLPPTAIDVLTADPPAFGVGESVVLTWQTTTATSCEFDNGIGEVETAGTVEVIPTETTTYTLTCTGPNTTATATIDAILGFPAEIGAFTVSPTHIIRGESAVLSWVSTETQGCTLEPGLGNVEVAGQVSVSPDEPTTYTLTCTGLLDDDTGVVDLQVQAPAPEIQTFGVVQEVIAPGDAAELFWTTESSETCTISPDVGDVEVNGSVNVTPTVTTAYTLTCEGEGDETVSSVVNVTVAPNVEISAFSAMPAVIEEGDSTILVWDSANADSCELTPDIGDVDTTGVFDITPASTTTYLLACTGPASSATEEITVDVVGPISITTFTANPMQLELGQATTLSWAAQNADSCSISPDIGDVEASGALTDVQPSETTTYLLSCSGPVNTVESQAEVVVLPVLDVAEFSLGSETIEQGTAETLTWSVVHAEQCEIQPGVGVVELTGTTMVSPSETETYTIECENDVVTKTESVTLEVVPPMTLTSFQASSDYFQTPSSDILLEAGDDLLLQWESANASSCVLNGGVGTIAVNGTLTVNPTESISYEISCSNAVKTLTLNVHVTVVPQVLINNFSGQPYAIEPGGETTLTWNVSDADACQLEGPGLESDADAGTSVMTTDAGTTYLDVGLEGSMDLALAESSWYALRCTGPAGEEESSVQIVVVEPVEILFFDADPSVGINHEDEPLTYPDSLTGASIESNDYVQLDWDTQNATSGCEIDQNIGAVAQASGVTPYEAHPTADTTYTLTCSNPAGSRSAQLEVLVFPPIQIVSFSADPLTIDARETTTLNWATVDASSCELDSGLGVQPTSGSLEIDLQASATITLSCDGPIRTTFQTVNIVVLPPNGPAAIATLDADPLQATVGEEVLVSWELDGALEDSLTFYPSGEDVAGELSNLYVPFPEPSLFHQETLVGLEMTNPESATAYLLPSYGETAMSGSGDQTAVGLARDNEDSVYFATQFSGTALLAGGTPQEVTFSSGTVASVLSKYDAAGTLLWAKPLIGTNPVELIDIDTTWDGIVAVGRFSGDLTVGEGATEQTFATSAQSSFFLKFDGEGNLLWADYAQGGNTNFPNSIDVAVDGRIIVSGQYQTSLSMNDGQGGTVTTETNDTVFADGYIASFSNDGVIQWLRGIAIPFNSYIVDAIGFADGTTVATGSFQQASGTTDLGNGFNVTSAGSNDILLMRLDDAGQTVWAKSIGSTEADYGQFLANGPDGSFFLGGQFRNFTNWGAGFMEYRLQAIGGPQSGELNYIAGRFDEDGELIWSRGAGGLGADRIADMAVSPNGNLILAGTFTGTAFFNPNNAWASSDYPGFSSVYQIINSYGCTNCHTSTHSSGMDLNSDENTAFAEVLETGENRAIPFDPDNSLLLKKPMLDGVTHGGGQLVTMGDSFYTTVKAWIENGAPREAPKAVDPPQTIFSTTGLGSQGNEDTFLVSYGAGDGQMQWLTQIGGDGLDGPDSPEATPNQFVLGSSLTMTGEGRVWVGVSYENELYFGEPGTGQELIGDSATARDTAMIQVEIPNRRFVRVEYRPVSLATDVAIAFAESVCIDCHSAGQETPNLALDSTALHTELATYVVAGDPDNSSILTTPLFAASHQPDGGLASLSEGEPLEALLNQWILEGAGDN